MSLDPMHNAILRFLVTQPDGATANWVAEVCHHHYDTPWASRRLRTLIKNGLVESPSAGWYRLTSDGYSAVGLTEHSGDKTGNFATDDGKTDP